MSVYCPDCGQLLQNAGDRGGNSVECSACLRPLGDPNHESRPSGVERGVKAVFVGSLPAAVAWILSGSLLLALCACLLFPTTTQQWLASLGLSRGVGEAAGRVPLRLVEILMAGVGLCALFVLVRLPARRRSQGRM